MPSRAVRAAALVVAALALAACASIPTSGPVREGDDLQVARPKDAVPFIAEPPAAGASAEDVVRGFLRAGADFREDHEVARAYLTPSARQRWQPRSGTSVYDRVEAPEAPVGGPVTVSGTQVATIDEEGRYRPSPAESPLTRTFGMDRVDGEWRIADLEDGLLLSMTDMQESFRQVSLYFLSPVRNTVVPDTVLLPELPGLPTRLVSRLLRGPTASLQGAVRTAFPQGTELEVPSVPVRDGLATVRLDAEALRADDDDRQQMAAQVVWTLKQLGPEIDRIRITAGGEDLIASGVEAEQPRDAWPSFDPDVLAETASVYVVRQGSVGRVIDREVQPVNGPAGSGDPPVRTPAVSLDQARIALVSPDGTALSVGRLAADGVMTDVLSGGDLSRPSWDVAGNLWVADRSSGELLVLPEGDGPPVTVLLPRLPGGLLDGVAVSRDGSRVALVLGAGRGARLVVAAVGGADQVAGAGDAARVTVTAPAEVLPDLRGVRDVAWADSTTLVTVGSLSGLSVRAHYVSTDGYRVGDIEPRDDLVSLAAAPGDGLAPVGPLVAGTAAGELVELVSGQGWVGLGEGSDPAFPG